MEAAVCGDLLRRNIHRVDVGHKIGHTMTGKLAGRQARCGRDVACL